MRITSRSATLVLGTVLFGALVVASGTKAATTPVANGLTSPIGTTQTYNNNPAFTLTGNKDLPLSQFKRKEEILSKFKFSADHQLVSTKLVTLRDDLATQHLNEQRTDVAGDRMVWVVETYHPNGIDTRGGFYEHATVVVTFDAETGVQLASDTTGHRVKGSGPLDTPESGNLK